MKEKILEWGNLWGMNIGSYYETDKYVWFSIDTDLSIRKIESLKIYEVNAKLDSVGWAEDNKLVVWLKIDNKGE